uniref:Uncharacterized protein n=1 Tax=Stomoxys calcitrans TaxID=35570 RepID=A0A1I8PD45_STOCA
MGVSEGFNCRVLLSLMSILVCFYAVKGGVGIQNGLNQEIILPESLIRFASQRCMEQYPQADAFNWTDTADTHCYSQCLLHKMGLMNLRTRGLDNIKLMDIWDDIEEAFDEERCVDNINIGQPLSGKCVDSYSKLMELRTHCLELFEYTFMGNSSWKSKDPSKSIGQSASEFCDSFDEDGDVATESTQSLEITFQSLYKNKLVCLYQNYHFIDAYGRVDDIELLRSYEEAQMDVTEAKEFVKYCSHKANSKFKRDNLSDAVFELQYCLKQKSPEFEMISQLRNERSRSY